jgi:photosystem II stability/assembly factor-like uncharacterized protein
LLLAVSTEPGQLQIGGLSEVAVGPLVAAGGHLWAGSSGTGVWVLQQETLRWERIPTSSLENDYVFSLLPLGIADVASGDVLVGSYGYLYGRLDSASTFSRVPNEGVDADNVFDFAVLDDGTILSASQTEGIQRSDDRGRTFRLSRDGIVPWATAIGIATDLRSVAAGADGSGVVVAGTSGGLGSGIWRSTDRGRTWAPTEQSEGLVGPVRYLRGHDLCLASLSGAGVVTSRDGLRWTAANEGLRSLDVTGVATDGARVFITAGGAVYEGASLPDVRWQFLDERCAPPQAVAPAIVERPDGRWLFVAAGSHGARRHAID